MQIGRTETLASAESWLIGAGEDCAIRIRSAEVRVAELAKREGRLFIRNLCLNEDVLINGERVAPRSAREITRFDDVNVAGTAIVIGPEHFLGDINLGIDTTELHYRQQIGAQERVLNAGVFLRAGPATFTAIMGPSGCGKTVFLNLLNGYKQPTEGRVIIGQRYDLRHAHGHVSN